MWRGETEHVCASPNTHIALKDASMTHFLCEEGSQLTVTRARIRGIPPHEQSREKQLCKTWNFPRDRGQCVDMGLMSDVSDTTDSVLIIRVFISGISCCRPSSTTCGRLSHLPLMMEMLIVSEMSDIISTTQVSWKPSARIVVQCDR
jgi:hypothetical protein